MQYVILSSCIYLGTFLYPSFLYVGVFIWLIPLIIYDIQKTLNFIHGYLWGIIFFAGHLSWLACTIIREGQGDARILIYLITVCYFALFSGFWFWLKTIIYRKIIKFFSIKRNEQALFCAWLISTVTFFYLTCYCSLALFDCFEGYPFMNPLLPLVSWSWYIRPIKYFGMMFYWICIVCINILCASAIVIKCDSNRLIFLCILLLFPCLVPYKTAPHSVQENKIVFIQPSWNDNNLSAEETFYTISRSLDRVACTYPYCKYVIIPESGFAYNLCDWVDRLEAWSSLFSDDVTIFIGSHRYENTQKYNTTFVIRAGKIITWYDKSHLVLCVERIPWLCLYIPILSCLFKHHEAVFDYPSKQSDQIEGFQIYMCSELFFEYKQPCYNKPILFLCNETWLSCNYMKNLAQCCARLYSFRHLVSIVYAANRSFGVIF